MSDTALTGPFSYSKACSTFRTVGAHRATTRTGLGGVPFIDFQKHSACVLAFIFQQSFQCRPASVQHRLGHVRLCQPRAGHVPDHDQAVIIHQPPAEFMQRIVPPIADFGVNRLHPLRVSRPLSNAQLLFLIPIEATRFQRLARAWGGRGFQTQIDPHTAGAACLLRLCRHDHAEIPAPASVFGETTRPECILRQPVAVPNLEILLVSPSRA